jgi:MFS transporter, DHA1 family, multidrug resistance protein
MLEAPEPARPRPAVVWLDRRSAPHIVTLVAIAGLAALNMNMVLPSLPGLAADFDTEYAIVALAVSAYLGMTAVQQLVVGPLSDRYGRRPVILWCLAIFLVATLGCWFAPNVEVFLAFRMLQTVVAVGLVLSRAIVRDMVPMDEAASMIGYVTMGMSLAPMVGPMVGGFLDQAFGWRSVFALTFVFGVGTLALAWVRSRRDQPQPIGELQCAVPRLSRTRPVAAVLGLCR